MRDRRGHITFDAREAAQIRMDRLNWDQVRQEFDDDGSLRDIYVFGTELLHWQQMLDALRSAGYGLEYSLDGKPLEVPRDVADVFAIRDDFNCLLSARFADARANCHFFIIEEIEIDIDPCEVTGQQELDALLGLMRCVAQAVRKEVVFTPENCPEIVIFRVVPDEEVIEYHEFGGWV